MEITPGVAPEAFTPPVLGPHTPHTPQTPRRKPLLQRQVPAGVATGLIVIATLAFYFLFNGIGQAFFWNTYDRRPPQERAYEAALKRVKENPESADAHVALGWALFQKGQYNEALASYKRATDLDPKHFKAHYNLGLAYAKVEKWDRATDQFERAIEISPNNFQPHYDLGLAYRALGKLDDALQELNLAYKLNPGSVDIIYALGQVYEQQGDQASAAQQYQAALTLDPNYGKAAEALKKLAQPASPQGAGGTK